MLNHHHHSQNLNYVIFIFCVMQAEGTEASESTSYLSELHFHYL